NSFGALVIGIEPHSPAAAAGLNTQDIVVKLGQETVAGVDDLVRLLDGSRVDQPVAMTGLRFGKLVELTVRPSVRPSAARRHHRGGARRRNFARADLNQSLSSSHYGLEPRDRGASSIERKEDFPCR